MYSFHYARQWCWIVWKVKPATHHTLAGTDIFEICRPSPSPRITCNMNVTHTPLCICPVQLRPEVFSTLLVVCFDKTHKYLHDSTCQWPVTNRYFVKLRCLNLWMYVRLVERWDCCGWRIDIAPKSTVLCNVTPGYMIALHGRFRGSMFIRSVSKILPDCTALDPRR
jgi:hypothetical protein